MEMTKDQLARMVGSNIRRAREAAGLTQVDLAKRTGIPQGHVSALELGKRSPNLGTIAEIAEALSVEPAHLFIPSTVAAS